MIFNLFLVQICLLVKNLKIRFLNWLKKIKLLLSGNLIFII